ncbi:MAG: tetratricopeptide repeat protein [Panacagrimonas sp.]
MIARTSRWLAWLLVLATCAGIATAQDKADIEALKERARSGERKATRELAEMYYVGRGGVEQNFGEAARWYERLAKQGDPRAQTSLGLMYARGYGVAKNMDTARRWWNFAASQNDPGAQYNLGVIYAEGDGVPQDYPQAAHWLDLAAQRGHVQAQHNLAMLYHDGKGVGRDPVRAYFWMKVAALQGDDGSEGALKLVGQGLSEREVRQAETEAAEWMKRYKKIVGQ